MDKDVFGKDHMNSKWQNYFKQLTTIFIKHGLIKSAPFIYQIFGIHGITFIALLEWAAFVKPNFDVQFSFLKWELLYNFHITMFLVISKEITIN